MKKKICVTTFVFGNDYQEFIPFFIYSCLKAYPDYYVHVYCHQSLTLSIQRQLSLLSNYGNFKITEGYLHYINLSGQQGKAIRFLIDSPDFSDFESIYIGDIDILFLLEEPPLFFQHMHHCSILGLPYSNVVREVKINLCNPKYIIKRIQSYGINGLSSPIFNSNLIERRLSGLHFIKTDEYFSAVRNKLENFFSYYINKQKQNKEIDKKYLLGFHNETMLYNLMEDSGVGLPPLGKYGPFMLDYRGYDTPWFRPHHGIHLGIFRNPITESSKKILDLDVYSEYYSKYRDTIQIDPLFQQLLSNASEQVKLIFNRFENYYRI